MVMISLQSTEEGKEAGVRGWVGQKLLDLPVKLKNICVCYFHYSGKKNTLVFKSLQEQGGSLMAKQM